MVKRFRDRTDAGEQLAAQLMAYRDRPDVLVLALPRGGVTVGFEIAHQLHAPLDVMIVRKLGVPGQEELALGALAPGGIRVFNEDVVRMRGISSEVIEEVAAREQRELERRERLYRGNRPASDVRGRTVILVDDGIATGATIRAAIAVLRQQQPAHLIIAVPVAVKITCDEFTAQGYEVVCPLQLETLYAVGSWYEYFPQTSDEEVHDLLVKARHEQAAWLEEQQKS